MSEKGSAVLEKKKDEKEPPKKDRAYGSPHNPNYVGPYVEIGLTVLWFPQGNRNVQPTAAVVSGVGNQNISVSLVTPDNRDLLLREGVYHLSDNRCRRPEQSDTGGWDYRPFDKELLGLM